jgi:hypothetical protein
MMILSSSPSESSECPVKVKTGTFTRIIDSHTRAYHQLVNVVKVLSTLWRKKVMYVGVGTWVQVQEGVKANMKLILPSLPSPKASSSMWGKE